VPLAPPEELDDVVDESISGGDPKARPYVTAAPTVPVATACWMTFDCVAAAVRY
jgi:hypothetical protein